MKARLGSIKFQGLKAPSDFSRTTAASYAEHALFGRKPKLQLTGQALDVIELGIEFHASFCNPSSEIETVRNRIRSGTVLPFTLDSGETLGRFVIEAFTETWRKTFIDGTILAAAGTIKLREVATDSNPVQALRAAAQSVATAIATNNPAVVIRDNRMDVPDGGRVATASVRRARSVSARIRNFAQRAGTVISEQTRFLRQAQQAAQQIEDEINNARSIITAGQQQIRNAQRALDRLQEAGQRAAALRNASSLSDITGAVSAATALTDSLDIANQACSGLASQVATRQYP